MDRADEMIGGAVEVMGCLRAVDWIDERRSVNAVGVAADWTALAEELRDLVSEARKVRSCGASVVCRMDGCRSCCSSAPVSSLCDPNAL